MGTPVPPEWPELIDGKYYCVTEDAYQGPTGCTGPVIGRTKCCHTGAVIQNYIDLDYECTFGIYLCPYGSPAPKRIVCIKGPYDNKTLCEADCS